MKFRTTRKAVKETNSAILKVNYFRKNGII